MHLDCIINRTYFSFQIEIILFTYFFYLFGATGIPLHRQVGFSCMHKKGNFIQVVLLQLLICLAADF